MPLDAFGLAIAAAGLHALWNVLLARAGAVLVAVGVILIAVS